MKFLAASILALAAAAGSAHGAILSQTFTMPNTLTDITTVNGFGTGTFKYWQTMATDNGVNPATNTLNSVTLRINTQLRLTTLSITNSDLGNPHTFNYVTFSNLAVVGTAPAADKTTLSNALDLNGGPGTLGDIDLFLTGPVAFAAGQTINFAPPIVIKNDDSTTLGAASVVPYNTAGTFTLGFTTNTSQSFIGGGGNANVTQVTDANATITVVYNYTAIPAPASVALLGLGGLVATRRRRA